VTTRSVVVGAEELLRGVFASTKHGPHGRNRQRRFSRSWLRDLGVHQLVGKVRPLRLHMPDD
jgi:hypothetical protein